MGIWLWPNVVLMALFLCCWAGIPLWHTLNRWNDELSAKHAELAARTVSVPVAAQPAAAAVDGGEADMPVYAGSR